MEVAMKKLHYGWFVCAACTLVLFCTIGFTSTAFSVYIPYINEFGGLTKTQGGVIIMVRCLVALFFIPIVEIYYQRTNIRIGVVLMLITLAGSFVLYSVAQSFAGFCIAAAVSGVCYGLGGMIPISILINRWFKSHQGLAIGICSAGSGATAIVMPPILTSLIEKISLPFAFLTQAAFVGIVAVITFVVLRNTPAEKGLKPLEDVHEGIQDTQQPQSGEQIPRKIMYRMYMAILLFGMGGYGTMQNIATLYATEGFSGMAISLLMTLYGIALLLGKLLYGRSTDLFGTYKSGYIFSAILITGGALCCFAGFGSAKVAIISMICLGLGLPLITVGISICAKDMSCPEEYGKVIKNFQFFLMAGSALSGPIPGVIADISGSYAPAYALLTTLIFASVILIQYTYWQTRRNNSKLLTDMDV